MSATAPGSSPAHAGWESPAHALDDPVESLTNWAVATRAVATHYQMGWPPFNHKRLNRHSDARDKYLKHRRVLTCLVEPNIGQTMEQTFIMDRVTGVVTAQEQIWNPPQPPGTEFQLIFLPCNDSRIEIAEANHLKLTGVLRTFERDPEDQWTLEIFQANINQFELSTSRCAALLDRVNLDEYPLGSTVDIGYQTDPDQPNPGSIVTTVQTRDLGTFPYESFHELGPTGVNRPMASYEHWSATSQAGAQDFWSDMYFVEEGSIPLRQFGSIADIVILTKSQILMTGEICVTSRRLEDELDTPGGPNPSGTHTIVKCLPFAVAEPESLDGTRIVRFNPTCQRGYYWWFTDAWPKTYHLVEGELEPVLDYPVACDLPDVSGADPNCGSNPT